MKLNLAALMGLVLLCGANAGPARAAPITIEALITPKAESKLELADGSKRYLLATQREGKADGTGPLAGATMLEWGMHDVTPGSGANGSGYLVFTSAGGDIAYLRYQFHMTPLPGADGKPHLHINGWWEAAGGTGRFKGLRGAGGAHIDAPNANERKWILTGDLSALPE